MDPAALESLKQQLADMVNTLAKAAKPPNEQIQQKPTTDQNKQIQIPPKTEENFESSPKKPKTGEVDPGQSADEWMKQFLELKKKYEEELEGKKSFSNVVKSIPHINSEQMEEKMKIKKEKLDKIDQLKKRYEDLENKLKMLEEELKMQWNKSDQAYSAFERSSQIAQYISGFRRDYNLAKRKKNSYFK